MYCRSMDRWGRVRAGTNTRADSLKLVITLGKRLSVVGSCEASEHIIRS